MPKTGENAIYLYWDKILLLILAALAAYVVLTRVVSSPLRIESAGRTLTPDEIVAEVTIKARNLSSELQRADQLPPDDSEAFDKVQEYLKGDTADLPTNPLTSPRPGQEVRVGPAKFVTPPILEPINVQAESGIGWADISSASNNTFEDVDTSLQTHWVTVAAEFPFYKQYLAFAGVDPEVDEDRRLDKNNRHLIFARLEMQRQQLLPDGTWSETVSIDPYAIYRDFFSDTLDALAKLYTVPYRPEQQHLSNLSVLREWLYRPGFQEFIVRPEFVALIGFEQWYWPDETPKTPTTRNLQVTPTRLAGALPRSDQGPNYRETNSGSNRAAPTTDRRFDPTGMPLPQGIPGPMGDIRNFPDSGVMERPELGRTNPARSTNRRTRNVSANRVALPRTEYHPRRDPELIPIWAHDNSITPGSTYRYRLRVIMFNPICGSERAENRNVRTQAWLEGPWSQWSEPVETLQDRYFFFTGVTKISSRPPRAKLQVYAWDKGYWFRELFYYTSKGQTIGGPKDVKDPTAPLSTNTTSRRVTRSPRDPLLAGPEAVGRRTAADRPPVRPKISLDFTTGWTILEFKPDTEIQRPLDGEPGQSHAVETNELIVKNDETGQEVQRYSDLDPENTRKQFLDDIIKRQNALDKPIRRRQTPGSGRTVPGVRNQLPW